MTTDDSDSIAELRDKLAGSAVSVVLLTDNPPNAQIAVEVGMMMLLDRPFIVLALPSVTVPTRLVAAAESVVVGSAEDPNTRAALIAAMVALVPDLHLDDDG